MYKICNKEEADKYLTKNDYPDIYYLPQYGALYENDNKVWESAIFKTNDKLILYVYLKNNDHLESIYGYSGYYISENNTSDDIKLFIEWFRKECKERGYKTEKIRFNPYLCNNTVLLEPYYDIKSTKNTHAINVMDPNIYITKLDGKSRNMVKKGFKENLSFTFNKLTKEDVDSQSNFRQLYNASMKNKQAGQFYYFDDKYFEGLVGLDCVYLAIIQNSKKDILSMSLFIIYNDLVHYHLSCRGPVSANYAQNYLFYTMVDWAHTNNKKLIHLGGGLVRNDSLCRFKKKIGNIEYMYNFSDYNIS